MGVWAMAAIVAAAELAALPVREPVPAPGPALRFRLETVEAGDGSALVQAGAGYAAGKGSVALSARWRRMGPPGWPDAAEVSLAVERKVGRDRIDVELWRGLTRVSGGAGASITLRRAIGR